TNQLFLSYQAAEVPFHQTLRTNLGEQEPSSSWIRTEISSSLPARQIDTNSTPLEGIESHLKLKRNQIQAPSLLRIQRSNQRISLRHRPVQADHQHIHVGRHLRRGPLQRPDR